MIVIYLTILDFDLNPPGRLCFDLGVGNFAPRSGGQRDPPPRLTGRG